jgi:hypothetical protein
MGRLTKRTTKRVLALTIAAGALLGASPAFSLQASRPGVLAFTSPGDVLHLKDTGEKHWVKAMYRRSASPDTTRTLWNKYGESTYTNTGGGSKIRTLKACVEIDLWPDECTGWQN